MSVQKEIDLTGRTIGRMRVVCRESHGWKCICDCGKEPVFTENELRKARSCGRCIVVMGFDLATNSGWAVRYSWRSSSGIKCGVFSVKTNDSDDKTEWEEKYALAGNMSYRLLLEHKPDFVCIEQPEHNIRKYGKKGDGTSKIDPAAIKAFIGRLSAVMFKYGFNSPEAVKMVSSVGGGTSNANQMQLAGITGAVVAACMILGIPYGTIGSRTWHSFYYRKGTKPSDGMDWKDIAIATAELENIPLPSTKKDKRDAAEAIGIAGCWKMCKVPNIKWMQDRWMELKGGADLIRQQRNETLTSPDLFAGVSA